jgi:predicted Zn-dependent peptidase
MIQFDRFTLENGLRVLFHKEVTTPNVVVNTLYDVGARDESEDKTGFAHLFEHLMFGGSIHIPEFDTPLQHAGGENNAFTSNDITNYYDVVPRENIETALWLESDRMLSLAFTDKSLEVQRSVVVEEFKQRYLNQPYGDAMLELRDLCYKVHPYRWATIGKEIRHIEEATMDDVKAFFKKHYVPSNAILCISGNLELEEVKGLVQKWYGDIPGGVKPERKLPAEPTQTEFRERTITRKVPANAFYYAFPMVDRLHTDYLPTDVLSDALGRDKSSRLYLELKKRRNLVSEISAYILGSTDAGLLVISGKLNDGVSFAQLDEALWPELQKLQDAQIEALEMQRIMNKIRTTKEFQDQGILQRSMHLCQFELFGDAQMINEESAHYRNIQPADIQNVAKKVLRKENCNLLKIQIESHAE